MSVRFTMVANISQSQRMICSHFMFANQMSNIWTKSQCTRNRNNRLKCVQPIRIDLSLRQQTKSVRIYRKHDIHQHSRLTIKGTKIYILHMKSIREFLVMKFDAPYNYDLNIFTNYIIMSILFVRRHYFGKFQRYRQTFGGRTSLKEFHLFWWIEHVFLICIESRISDNVSNWGNSINGNASKSDCNLLK